MNDLFEHVSEIPADLKQLCDQYQQDNLTYEDCEKFLLSVEKIGYTFDFGLDAVPFNLRLKTEITSTQSPSLMKLLDVNDVYTDGFLVDDSGTVAFLSLIGKDTAIQELRARWSIPYSQGGLTDFQIETPDSTVRINIGNPESLEFLSGRLSTELFGDLIQVFVYKQLAQKPDYANRKALQLFKNGDQSDPADKLWTLIKSLSPLPLLDEWKDLIFVIFTTRQWIVKLPGMGEVSAHLLSIPEDELAELLKINIQCGALIAVANDEGSFINKEKVISTLI